MALPEYHSHRDFVSYSGVRLPLKLVNPLETGEVENRNTYFRGYYDEAERMVACEKRVYGEVEFCHSYEYHPSGTLKSALIEMLGEEPRRIDYPEADE